MQSHQQIRSIFVDFFKDKQHTVIPSSKIFLQDDPSLLFVNAGMNQFKDVFLGNKNAEHKRATNSQKCLRVTGKHNDLEDVGVDHYHHTLFEMLGSWSFGDYYKKEAIIWSWELLTQIFKLDKQKLWATVYDTDQESAEIWKTSTDIVSEHILFFGKKSNFWSMGNTGPCGPCSELHYDLGEDACDKKGQDHICSVNGDCSRYIELWNLVFMELERKEDGSEVPLEHKYVDTGMGLERITRVLQHKKSNYETDIFTPILSKIESLSGKNYLSSSTKEQIAFRVIADHIRTLCFSLADGIIPSNTGRGYVIRRILRRAYRYGKVLQMPSIFLASLVSIVVDTMGEHFTELKNQQAQITKIITEEEERFSQTLETGLNLFEKEVGKIPSKVIPGSLAFLLFDTYGFPLDLTCILAKEKGYTVDTIGFDAELDKQKKLSQENQKFKDKKTTEHFTVLDSSISQTLFLGYETLEDHQAKVVKYAVQDDLYQIVLDKTPFYAEGGGQIADNGILYGKDFVMYVEDVQKTPKEFIHYGRIEGIFNPQADISTKVEKDRRDALKKHHTGVHMLRPVLEKILEKPVEFNSTYVATDYFYADIMHSSKLSEEELRRVEEEMNRLIQSCYPIVTHLHSSVQEVNAAGINSRFNDRLTDKDVTRVVEITNITTDLCGGTHASNTGELGLFKIMADVSAGSNLRHLECVCGLKAWSILHQIFEESRDISYEIKSSVREVPKRALEILEENKTLKKEIKQIQVELSHYKFSLAHLNQKAVFKGFPFFIGVYKDATMPDIKRLASEFTNQNKNGIALLIAQSDACLYVLASSEEALSQGIDLMELHKMMISVFNAKGGGKGTIFNGSFTHFSTELQDSLILQMNSL